MTRGVVVEADTSFLGLEAAASSKWDMLIVGAGFFGLRLAAEARLAGASVLVVDQEQGPMLRASRNNQARVHRGFHYPRAYLTARRSAVGSARFMEEYPEAISSDFRSLYAIARNGSNVTPSQFEKFMSVVGVDMADCRSEIENLFVPGTVSALYETDEPAFNADMVRRSLFESCKVAGVRFLFDSNVLVSKSGPAKVYCGSSEVEIEFDKCLVASYAGIGGADSPLRDQVDLQLTEMVLVDPGDGLKGLGLTVMDGPFFSCMPWPAAGLHSLSHVRYTPHRLLDDKEREDPYGFLRNYRLSASEQIMAASQTMCSALKGARIDRSVVEIKALPKRNASTDGRPILWAIHHDRPDVAFVLGSKLDCVYDAEEYLSRFLGS
jgi:glycine/D-amino acid oxidase-like deaminating enzyme